MATFGIPEIFDVHFGTMTSDNFLLLGILSYSTHCVRNVVKTATNILVLYLEVSESLTHVQHEKLTLNQQFSRAGCTIFQLRDSNRIPLP